MQRVVDLWRDLVKIPSVAGGFIFPAANNANGSIKVQSVWKYMDIERNDNVAFSMFHGFVRSADTISPAFQTSPVEETASLSAVSASGTYTALLRKLTPGKKTGEANGPSAVDFLEVWNNVSGAKECSVNLKQSDKHGKVQTSGPFGVLEWSAGEGHLIYLAEKKSSAISFFDPKAETDDLSSGPVQSVGDEFNQKEHWGERFFETCQPVICVLDVPSGNVTVIDNIPEHISPAYCVWAPDDTGFVLCGLDGSCRKLGSAVCLNRKSALYFYELQAASLTLLSDENVAAYLPRFSPTGEKFVFLQAEIGGPHLQCMKLMQCDWKTRQITEIVGCVARPRSPDGFSGIYNYTESLPKRIWANDNKRLLLATDVGSKHDIVVIDTSKGDVSIITNVDGVKGSWNLIDVKDDFVLASRSAPNTPEQLVIGKLPKAYEETKIVWTSIFPNISREGIALEIDWRINSFTPAAASENKQFAGLSFEAILSTPKKGSDWPLVVVPHGGPHVICAAEWLAFPALLASLGYAVLRVNYRGSLGFGTDNVNSLLGNVGTQDVQDVQQAVESVLAENPNISAKKVVLCGGSHGGFLVTHLIGQYPDFYRACCAINPVVDIAAMAGQTDIPDWNYCEAANIRFALDKPTTPDLLKTMWDKSPIRFVEKVHTPLLLVLGLTDLRVPVAHSREYCQILKARGVKIKVLAYPENDHRIPKIDALSDYVLNTVRWFEENLN